MQRRKSLEFQRSEAGDAIIHGSKCIHYSEKVLYVHGEELFLFLLSKLSVERIEI